MAPPPPLPVEQSPGLVVVKLSTTHFTEEHVEAVGQRLFGQAEWLTGSRLVLDMARVDFLSSTGLGKLVSLNKRVRAAGGRLVLANVPDRVYELFAVTCLDRVLDVRRVSCEDLPAQLAS